MAEAVGHLDLTLPHCFESMAQVPSVFELWLCREAQNVGCDDFFALTCSEVETAGEEGVRYEGRFFKGK